MNELSETWMSCDFTATAGGQKAPPKPYSIPDESVRLLRARLILEEAKETINALGFFISEDPGTGVIGLREYSALNAAPGPLSLEQIIDGCCDTIYVAVGTLWACGVPDVPHILEVIRANNDKKSPGGVGVPHPAVPGKYGKPPGWRGPDHKQFFPKES